MRVYIESYGCWLNRAEADVMRTLMEREGAEVVGDPALADVIILNTCAVRWDTERRMLRRAGELHWIARRRGAKLVIAGCLARVRPARLSKVAPTASLLSPDRIEGIVDVVASPEREVRLLETNAPRRVLPEFRGGIRYVVPIQTGCVGSCAFCVGRVARPRLKSYDPASIVERVREAVARGAKEIYLTGQDVASYGLDIGTNIVELLEGLLSEVDGDYMVRVGMMEPSLVMRFVDGLVEAFRDERVYKYLHVPAQSFDDHVLVLMGRGYAYDDFRGLVEEFRRKIPDVTVATDLIAGFPGEDEEAFRNTLERLWEVQPDKVHVARYTIRPFTKAAYRRQVPEAVKSVRTRALAAEAFKVTMVRNLRYLGSVADALLSSEGYRRGSLVARLRNYRPAVLPAREGLRLGEWVRVRVVGCTPIDLRALPLPLSP